MGIYNDLIGLSYKKFAAKFNVGSNSYPNVISETKNLTLTKIVQVSSKRSFVLRKDAILLNGRVYM